MASIMKQTVTIDSLGKWGPKVGDEYFSYSKNLKDVDKVRIVPGAVLEMELYVADSGKKYINSVLGSIETTVTAKVTPKVKELVRASVTPKSNGTSMSKEEWASKDRSQLIGGLSHDAAELTAAFAAMFPDIATTEDALKLYKDFLVGMLNIREEVK